MSDERDERTKEYVFLTGKTKWFRATTPNQWGKYAHVLYPNPDSVAKIRELQERGLKNVMGRDENEDNAYRITISRPQSITVRGKPIGMTPPEVLMSDGQTPLKATNVGNGSDVTTKVHIYRYRIPATNPAKYGIAMRWVSSRIDHLVPFESTRDFNEDEKKAVEGLPEQPPQPMF